MSPTAVIKSVTITVFCVFALGVISGCAGSSHSEVGAGAEPIEPPQTSLDAEQSTAFNLEQLPSDFQIDEFTALYDSLVSSRRAVATKGRFESQAEYEQRLSSSQSVFRSVEESSSRLT